MWEEILMGLGLQSQEEKQMAPMSFFLKECLLGFKKKIKLQLNVNAGFLS